MKAEEKRSIWLPWLDYETVPIIILGDPARKGLPTLTYTSRSLP